MIFYLDDYNLLKVKKSNELLNTKIKLLMNEKEVDFDIKNDGDYLNLLLKEDYCAFENLKVLVDEKEEIIIPRFITHTKQFDEDYKVDLNTLGSFIEDDKTIFRMWSPFSKEAYLVLENVDYQMTYLGKGLFELVINENLDKYYYHYKVLKESIYEFNDPFSYINKDENNSYVIDERKLNKEKIIPEVNDNLSIYEISVRDFSSLENMPFKYPKKFLSLKEEGLKLDGEPIGFDYLKELGISHIQIMPIFSFDLDNAEYNWGYNPTSFNSLEKSYLVSEDPYEEIEEFKSVVDTYHKYNIRVNLDVVYNHVYRVNDFNLNKMLPYYFFRYDGDKMGNASFCGNETRSEAYFLSEYLKLICNRFVDIYDIDGLRFDIMGILDIDTINGIKEICKNKKPDFLIYGEGWNMGNILPFNKKATMENADKMKDVGFFNDRFRNSLRGKDIDNDDGYLFGKVHYTRAVEDLLEGSVNMNFETNQSVNYVECHDNFTLYDKVKKFVDEIYIKKIIKLALALTMLSKGLPFIHAGVEFLRTKNGIDNSYNLSDKINNLDWNRKNKNLETSHYLRDLIKLKKELMSYYKEDIVASFEQYYEVLIYRLNDLVIFINPCVFDHIYEDDKEYEIIFDEKGFNKHKENAFKIPSFSIIVSYLK